MIIIIATLTFIATLLGGLFALKLKDKLHLILGFSAGAVIAITFFDLLPESLDLSANYYNNGIIFYIVAASFLFYLILDRIFFSFTHNHDNAIHESVTHSHLDEDGFPNMHSHEHIQASNVGVNKRGFLAAGSLCLHSFLDGLAIGLAFQVSSIVGIVVAVAVLTHDFSDGINTISFVLKSGANRSIALRWLIVDAIAPVLGIISTLFFSVSEKGLGIILAIFSGFFLYIGASELIPESHHAHPKFLTTFMTILGATALFVVIRLAQ